MSIFMHQGSCWPCACQQTPGSITTTNETVLSHPSSGPLFDSQIFATCRPPKCCWSCTKPQTPLKVTPVSWHLFLTPKGKSNQRALCHCLWGYRPLHTTSRGHPAIKARRENNKYAQGSAIPMGTLHWISCGKLFMSQVPIHRPPWFMVAERQQLGLTENGSCDIWDIFWNQCF